MFEILMAWKSKSTARHFEIITTRAPTSIAVRLFDYQTTHEQWWQLRPPTGLASGGVEYNHEFNIQNAHEVVRVMDAILESGKQ